MTVAGIDYTELLRESVRGDLMGKGLLGARIDQLADLAVDALLAHGETYCDAWGQWYVRFPTSSPSEGKS